MTNSTYHVPVLFQESIDALDLKSNSVIVDVTYGGGGHSKEILKCIGNDGVLIAFDQDEDALANVVDDDRLIFVDSNFRFLYNFIKFHDLLGVDGLLADLGVSSHQFDVGERGFSIREEGRLDMRMNQKAQLSAFKVVNEYPEKELYRIFNSFADLQNTKRVVMTITAERKKKKISTTGDLVKILQDLVPPKKKNQFLAQVFQAIRIEVNDEMGALMDMLEQTAKVIKPGGKLVVISYHSIEDRLVKNFIKAGNFEGDVETDVFGVANVPFKAVNKKPIVPSFEEIERNPRARSAKLRIAVRT
ncbi:MAG: 16S rRNA (cytosine(1402)-N(4))-methyltransferase RsmH [Crocinitomicaceae bacterium]|nr:16S rRNA (cytosine(1402)-N(4))-methyltransferase RsmH [Crocinitomicaceae bacterium]